MKAVAFTSIPGVLERCEKTKPGMLEGVELDYSSRYMGYNTYEGAITWNAGCLGSLGFASSSIILDTCP